MGKIKNQTWKYILAAYGLMLLFIGELLIFDNIPLALCSLFAFGIIAVIALLKNE